MRTRRLLSTWAVVATTACAAVGIAANPAHANPGAGYIGPRTQSAEAVRCVQSAVGAHGDGDFGQQTFDAVRGFQATHGLSADGIVGPATGDHILPRTFDPAYCASFVPTTYVFVVDDTQIQEQPANPGDLGAAMAMGKPLPQCVAEGVKNSIMGAGRLAKIIWKRKLPSRGTGSRRPTRRSSPAAWCTATASRSSSRSAQVAAEAPL